MLASFSDFAQAIELVNDSRYGLQAGVFTNDIGRIERAWDELEVGGVMINEVPSFRVDHMPYGGTKDSGIGSRRHPLGHRQHDGSAAFSDSQSASGVTISVGCVELRETHHCLVSC